MSVRVPRTVDLYRQSMGGALDNAVFPQVKKLSLTISAGGFGYAFGGNVSVSFMVPPCLCPDWKWL